MKRIALLAITLMALSCTKQEEYTTLRFGIEGVEKHSITKATTDSVRTAIALAKEWLKENARHYSKTVIGRRAMVYDFESDMNKLFGEQE